MCVSKVSANSGGPKPDVGARTGSGAWEHMFLPGSALSRYLTAGWVARRVGKVTRLEENLVEIPEQVWQKTGECEILVLPFLGQTDAFIQWPALTWQAHYSGSALNPKVQPSHNPTVICIHHVTQTMWQFSSRQAICNVHLTLWPTRPRFHPPPTTLHLSLFAIETEQILPMHTSVSVDSISAEWLSSKWASRLELLIKLCLPLDLFSQLYWDIFDLQHM